MAYKFVFVKKDHPYGAECVRGQTWISIDRIKNENVEVYILHKKNDLGVRIGIEDTDAYAYIWMDPDSAIEFAHEIIRLANCVKIDSDQI